MNSAAASGIVAGRELRVGWTLSWCWLPGPPRRRAQSHTGIAPPSAAVCLGPFSGRQDSMAYGSLVPRAAT